MSPEELRFIDNLDLFELLPNGSYYAEFPKIGANCGPNEMDLEASRIFAEHVRRIAPTLTVEDRNGRVLMSYPTVDVDLDAVPF